MTFIHTGSGFQWYRTYERGYETSGSPLRFMLRRPSLVECVSVLHGTGVYKASIFFLRTTPNISISITGINKPRYEPLCSGCLKVENEIHFLFECNSYSTMRDDFTNSISSIVPNYLKLNNDQKLIYLMTCEDKNILRLTSLFVFNCFKRREISQLSSGGST
jgi:hypothetical protein